MTERLVPYRPLKQVAADANVMFVLCAAAAFGIGTVFADAHVSARVVLAYVSFVAAALISEAIGGWRARRRGAELITRPEWYRRIFSERAETSLWQNCASFGLLTASCVTVLALAILPMHLWTLALPVAVGTGLLGALAGAYAWSTARGHSRAIRTDARPSSYAVLAMRHYSGYALGIAAALIAATFVNPDPFSGLLLLAAFAAGKIGSDMLAPAIVLNTTAEMPQSFSGILFGCVWAVLWWGFPWGAIVAVVAHNEAGRLTLNDVAAAFGVPSAAAIGFYLYLTALMHISRGR